MQIKIKLFYLDSIKKQTDSHMEEDKTKEQLYEQFEGCCNRYHTNKKDLLNDEFRPGRPEEEELKDKIEKELMFVENVMDKFKEQDIVFAKIIKLHLVDGVTWDNIPKHSDVPMSRRTIFNKYPEPMKLCKEKFYGFLGDEDFRSRLNFLMKNSALRRRIL